VLGDLATQAPTTLERLFNKAFGLVHDVVFETLKKHLSEEGILALTYVVNMYSLHAVSTKALRLEYDDVPERVTEIPVPGTRRVQDWT